MSSPSRRSLLLASLAACHRPEPPAHGAGPPGAGLAPREAPGGTPAASRGVAAGVSEWQGTVRVPADGPARGKQFRGAWLETSDGRRWVITYDVRSPLREMRDEVVTVEAEPCQPPGQALVGGHLRVRSLRAANPQARLSAIGPPRTLRGVFRQVTGAPGSKAAGEVSERFVDDSGVEHPLAHGPLTAGDRSEGQARPAPGQAVEIEAHDVQLSPYDAHEGGAWLWVVSWR